MVRFLLAAMYCIAKPIANILDQVWILILMPRSPTIKVFNEVTEHLMLLWVTIHAIRSPVFLHRPWSTTARSASRGRRCGRSYVRALEEIPKCTVIE